MVQATSETARRTGVTGSALVRTLARLKDIEVPVSGRPLAEQLGLWLRWTDAISLSTALGANSASSRTSIQGIEAEKAEAARIRRELREGIALDCAMQGGAADFAPIRQRYLARQQAMDGAIGPLRVTLRAALARRSTAMAKLAAVDEIMAQALATHQHRLLATACTTLEKNFRQRKRNAEDVAENSDATPSRWQDDFGNDMKDLMLAELDFRFQPIDGLLDAL